MTLEEYKLTYLNIEFIQVTKVSIELVFRSLAAKMQCHSILLQGTSCASIDSNGLNVVSFPDARSFLSGERKCGLGTRLG